MTMNSETAQIWQRRVLPLLTAHLAECGGTMAAYLVLHDGAATVSLLEAHRCRRTRIATHTCHRSSTQARSMSYQQPQVSRGVYLFVWCLRETEAPASGQPAQ